MTKSEKEKLQKLASYNKLREVTNKLLELDASNVDFLAVASRLADYEEKTSKRLAKDDDLVILRNQISHTIFDLIAKIEVIETEAQRQGASETVKTNAEGEENDSATTSNSNEMNTYDFYLDAHKKMVKFVMACEQWSPSNKHKDKELIEGVTATLAILPKLYSCLKSEGKEDQYFLEEIEFCISEINLLQREMVSINVANLAFKPNLRLKLFEPQKKINAIILNIAKKLQIDFASKNS